MRSKCRRSVVVGCVLSLGLLGGVGEPAVGMVIDGHPLGGDAVDILSRGSELAGLQEIGGARFVTRDETIALELVMPVGTSRGFMGHRRQVVQRIGRLLSARWARASVEIRHGGAQDAGDTGRRAALLMREELRERVAMGCRSIACAGVGKRIRVVRESGIGGMQEEWIRVLVHWE